MLKQPWERRMWRETEASATIQHQPARRGSGPSWKMISCLQLIAAQADTNVMKDARE